MSRIENVGKGTRYFSPEKARGKDVYYYRRPGFPKIRLDEKPGTPAMNRAFWAADAKTNKLAADRASGVANADRPKVVCKAPSPAYVAQFGDVAPGQVVDGTVRWIVERFYASPEFASLGDHSRQCYRINLTRALAVRTSDGKAAFGDFAVDDPDNRLKLKHITAVQARLADKPATADGTVKNLRTVFNWAIREELFDGANPCVGATWLHPYNDENGGWMMWGSEQIEKYIGRHPIGTPAYMLFALMFYGGVRISDAARLGPFNLKKRASELHWTEWKGGRSKALGKHRPRPKLREIPLPPQLADAIAATKTGHGLFVLTKTGAPYKPESVQKAFERFCGEAGIEPGYSAHGVRKAAAALMYAKSGGNLAMLCDWFGWKLGSRMAVWYAKQFERKEIRASAVEIFRIFGSSKKEAA
jgi:integrase